MNVNAFPCELVAPRIRERLREYVAAARLKSLVLGVSGGVDSAVTAALAAPVCRALGLPLIGRSLPIKTNHPDELARARAVGENFCTDFREIDLAPAFALLVAVTAAERTCEDSLRERIRLGNLKARARMLYLYNLAFAAGGMVLSTDNLTEYYLGFWTLHGDVGDFGMIQELWKTEVYALCEWLAAEARGAGNAAGAEALLSTGAAAATDGLGVAASSLAQIGGASYEEVDRILKSHHEAGSREFADHPVIKRSLSNAFKRRNPYNLRRQELLGE